ncbi:MAG TPA: glutamine--tRNA ligase/YqeY domain fusion protein [Verrucomicrobiales bacterium]|nr:glutamine--tRNA ligase/YqeY domain fusion protein [Verrucomicrobiales bacterium]
MSDPGVLPPSDFIRDIVAADVSSGRHQGRVVTRFPPEPNGYLHIGHAKSICLNFGIAASYPGGRCHLRFDDTNPLKEEVEFVDSIRNDVRWLGFDWGPHEYYASDYFEQLYRFAEDLITKGLAYVDSLSQEELRQQRGTLTEPGRESPYRDRSIEENLDLFRRMRAGEFPEGSHVLRARIDMAHPNVNMRDPVVYRILHAQHHRTGDKWRIYPMYDYAHCISDALEGITHSICTLEFEHHRPLYDWFLDNLDVPCHPQQIEFARLSLGYTVLSKRRLLQLVKEGRVSGWDDPRMPTISGIRRRGYPSEALRRFAARIGVTKFNALTDIALLEHSVRDQLNAEAPRALAVLRPLRVVLTNYPEDGEEQLEAVNHPENPAAGTRSLPFCRELFIEQDDFLEDPPRGFFRLAPGREVRLRYAYYITCEEVVRDAAGQIAELHCRYDPATRGGDSPDGRKVKGTLHWVSARHAAAAEVRLYDRLFQSEDPSSDPGTFLEQLNPGSLEVLTHTRVEPAIAAAEPGSRFQFERLGYFCVDPDSAPGRPVFNRTIALRDTWARAALASLKDPGSP